MNESTYDVVIPTIGRPSLATLLQSLAATSGPAPGRVIIVDDRAPSRAPLALGSLPPDFEARIVHVSSGGRGPASARNRGWHASSAEWIAFLDDDVVVGETWASDLAFDRAACNAGVAGTEAIISVPLPGDRRPTDWERNVARLAASRWITADCAVRRSALQRVGGFDERFRRAYREDTDLALRLADAGYVIVRGRRTTTHPVRPADPWVSLRLQAGNADDALLDALHGRDWRTRTGELRGIFPVHVATVAAAGVASVAALAWAALTLRFAWQRIAPGPRTPREIAAMAVTSIAIPFAAVAHRVRGTWRARRERRVGAVLFDRDGTLIADVPALRDPDLVAPLPGAAAALARARRAGLRIGVVSNQPAVGDGRVQPDELVRVHERVRALLGPIDTWSVCTHPAGAGCACRKPQPGGIAAAADALGLAPQRCVMIGDIGSDVDAAQAAGARAILVPTAVTRPEEVTAALSVASDIAIAVDRVVRGRI